MKIYAVRDRLVDYYMQPFVGQTDKQVLAALAATINNKEQTSAIQAAPHHFEIWTLGEVDEETGRITPKLELLADAASLIRSGVRTATEARSRAGTNGSPDMGGEGAPDAPRAPTGA